MSNLAYEVALRKGMLMRAVIVVLTVLLFSVHSYALDDQVVKTDEVSGCAVTEQASIEKDAGTKTDIDIKGSMADSNEVYGEKAEFADDYGYGTAQRELNVQDYGAGDMGEDSLEQ